MSRRKKRRFPIGLALVPDIRLSIFSQVVGPNRTVLVEQWVTERLTQGQCWDEIKSMLRQEAALLQIPVEQHIREILQNDGFESDLELENIDLSVLLDEPKDDRDPAETQND
jgi:hypothetical protein